MNELTDCPEPWFSDIERMKFVLPVAILILIVVNSGMFYFFPIHQGISNLPEFFTLLITLFTVIAVVLFFYNRGRKHDTWTRNLEFNKELFSSLNAGIQEMLEGLNYDYDVGPKLSINDNEWSKLFTIKLPSLPELKMSTVLTVIRSKYDSTKLSYVSIANIYPENLQYAREMLGRLNGILAGIEGVGKEIGNYSDDPENFLEEMKPFLK